MALAFRACRSCARNALRLQASHTLRRPLSSPATAQDVDDDVAKFPGQRKSARYITEPSFQVPDDMEPMPVYRVMKSDGVIDHADQDPQLSQETVEKMFYSMVSLSEMDKIMYESQRQGRISFYMTAHGEEATLVGSAAAMQNEDPVFAQYREAAVLLWRGFTVQQCVDQCYGNVRDIGKGKQMPVHYGSAKLSYITISSPLATQLPQASGAAYALKRSAPDLCVITYFGDGAASEGDAHAALNFAATLQCPMIFFCRNNGYAISTPTSDQYRGDGIASRGVGYGINTIRVDGNDAFAVYNATKAARKMALEQERPVLVEAMTYRLGHHSTSDDSSAYRKTSEVRKWEDFDQPIFRLGQYMKRKGWLTEEAEKSMRKECLARVKDALANSEKESKPPMQELFGDVYKKMPPRLVEQREQLNDHVANHKQHYPIGKFSST